MVDKSRIYWFEPIIFLFLGAFHLQGIWGLLDRNSYSDFWFLNILPGRMLHYLFIIVPLLLLLVSIITLRKNIGRNYWWRWICIILGSCALFFLYSDITNISNMWITDLLFYVLEPTNPYWNAIWGVFVIMGLLYSILVISITRRFFKHS